MKVFVSSSREIVKGLRGEKGGGDEGWWWQGQKVSKVMRGHPTAERVMVTNTTDGPSLKASHTWWGWETKGQSKKYVNWNSKHFWLTLCHHLHPTHMTNPSTRQPLHVPHDDCLVNSTFGIKSNPRGGSGSLSFTNKNHVSSLFRPQAPQKKSKKKRPDSEDRTRYLKITAF